MNAYYRLYRLSIYKLVATLVLKSVYEAKAVNSRLVSLGNVVDQDDPSSWRYYMNLAGEYHSTQEMMRIISLDTEELIDFTKENLLIHRATRKEYVYGNRYYDDLIDLYPAQKALINGIINPVDKAVAIAAKDHTILSYDKSLVEAAEQQLIPSLQRFIDNALFRWYNADYGLFEKYYYPGFIGKLATKLPLEIINIRKRACKTDQAHSYHIRQYLSSFSPVGAEFDYMTQRQRLTLYRNIKFLNLNLGRKEIFEWLTQKFLTDRGFSLASYDIVQSYKDITTTLKAEVSLERTTLNGIEPATGGNRKTVGQLLDMELTLARDNYIDRDDTEIEVIEKGALSLFSRLPTKVLESNVIDQADAEPFTLTEVLLNHWIYLSHYDRFKSVITVTNPANGDIYRLSVKNAFIFYLYAYNKAIDIELFKVPIVAAKRVRRIPLPTFEELRATSEIKKVPNYYIDYILQTQVDIGTYISVDAFREACTDIQRVMLSHRAMRHYNGDYIAEGQLHTMIDRCYMDIKIDLAGEMDYDLWLKSVGIDTSSMGRIEYAAIATSIFKSATGAEATNASQVRAIHAAMIRIMRAMSSYSVQYIAQINDSPIKVLDGKFPKLTIPKEDTHSHYEIELDWPTILDLNTKAKEKIKIDPHVPSVGVSVKTESILIKVPAYVGVKLVGTGSLSPPIPVSVPIASLKRPAVTDLSDYTQDGIAGYEAIPSQDLSALIISNQIPGYEALTEARRRSMLHI